MARQYLIPGSVYLNETGESGYLIPGGGFIQDTSAPLPYTISGVVGAVFGGLTAPVLRIYRGMVEFFK